MTHNIQHLLTGFLIGPTVSGLNVLTLYEMFGAVVTAASALIAYARADETQKKQQAAIVSSFGLTLTMLLSIRYDLLPKMDDHLALAEAISKDSELTQVMQRVSEAQAFSYARSEPLMGYIEQQRIRGLETTFDDMAQGRFEVDESEMPDFALEMVKSAQKSIFATSYVQFKQWWDLPWGKKYEALNREAIRDRKVQITRVFIFSKKEDFQNALPHLKAQLQDGIKVQYAYVDDLATKLTSDMVVVDDRLAGELRLTPEKGMKDAVFYTKPADIQRYRGTIQDVVNDAETFLENSKP